jgi:hypothetical protein
MSGAIPPLPQYAFMARCLVKAQGQLYLLPLTSKQTQSLQMLRDAVYDKYNTTNNVIHIKAV